MDLNSSILVTGTIRLLNDLITALTGISILIATVMGIYYLAKKSSCDEQEGKFLTRRLFVAIGCCVLITIIKVLIQVITSYYTSCRRCF